VGNRPLPPHRRPHWVDDDLKAVRLSARVCNVGTMKYGIVTSAGTVHDYVTMAREAEAHGWDGVFVWDDICVGPRDVFDPWVTLGAMALGTVRITLGAMVFSLARRRPWKVARETLTLDNLANGRLVVPVGFGGSWDGGFSRVNTDEPGRKARREKLDECLEILARAWSGEPFDYEGKHYRAKDLVFRPRPVQQPRIPVWTIGAWPHERSLGRSARWAASSPSTCHRTRTHPIPFRPRLSPPSASG